MLTRIATDGFLPPATGSPSAMAQHDGRTAEDVAVEFKPNDVSYRGMSQYQNGQLMPRVIFRTEVLPRGTPTDRFGPYLSSNRRNFLIDVAVEVQQNKIILHAIN